ncbi:MAG: hypothetical protein ACKOFG_16265 [Limnohabitans sp.]|jgi:hypothetical protein
MKHRALAIAIGSLMAWGPAAAFELVTAQELQASQAAPERVWPKSAPAPEAPQIELIRPQLGHSINSPTAIDIRFKASPGSQVRPESFRIFYGRLRLDITDRVVQNTAVSREGLSVSQASLPKGQHRLLLSIEDTQNRTGQAQLDFQIQ